MSGGKSPAPQLNGSKGSAPKRSLSRKNKTYQQKMMGGAHINSHTQTTGKMPPKTQFCTEQYAVF